MNLMKWAVCILVAMISLMAMAVGVWHVLDDQPSVAESQGAPTNFRGNILAASDTDQSFGAYADGILNQLPGVEDTISIISTDTDKARVLGAFKGSQAVMSWPQIIDVSPDGTTAFIVETRGKPEAGVRQVADVYTAFKPGQYLTIADISIPENPRILSEVAIGQDLNSVMVSPDGSKLLVTSTEKLILLEINGSVIKAVHSYTLDTNLNVPVTRPGVRSGAWHPDGQHFGVNISDHAVAFYRVGAKDRSGKPIIELVGKPLVFGETLSIGEFHPAGDYFFIADVAWNTNLVPTDFVFNGNGSVYVLQFESNGEHKIVDQIKVQRSPEGFAVSPDGSRLVTVNMNRTYLPSSLEFWAVPGRDRASLSLIKFNPETGKGVVVDSKGFNGNLPENATFDLDGNAVAVAIYEYEDRKDHKGYVSYWRIEDDVLIPTGVEVAVARGVHDLIVIPE